MIPTPFIALAVVVGAEPGIGIEVRAIDLDPVTTASVTSAVMEAVRDSGFDPISAPCRECDETLDVSLIGGVARFDIEVRVGDRHAGAAVPMGPKADSHGRIAALVQSVLPPSAGRPGGESLVLAPPEAAAGEAGASWMADGLFVVSAVASVAAVVAAVVANGSSRDLQSETHFDEALDSSVSSMQTATAVSIVSLSLAGASLAGAIVLSD